MMPSENITQDKLNSERPDDTIPAETSLSKKSEFMTGEDIPPHFPLDTCNGSHESSLSSHSSSSSSLMGSMLVPAKMILFRGHHVAAFDIGGKEMICLPQVYEIFLKNMVGGLHTVYTKLKRLDISPVVCNVEQVRTLRSLGAIQPGVNRCKLLEKSDFETLYEDCTSTGTRPGRPSKRGNFSDWSEMNNAKKEKSSSTSSGESPVNMITTLEGENNSGQVFNQMLPQLTPQQILMHHFVALTQKSSSNQTFERTDDDERSQRRVDDGTPLNLSKSGANSENDNDSLENMRKEDSSPNNSLSDRGGSNSNSLSMSMEGGSSSGKNEEGTMMNKVMSLIEIASQQFKHEREELWKERNEIQVLRESFHKIVQEERDLRKKLESQSRKCAAYEKRYKYVNRQLLLVNAELRRYKETDRANNIDNGRKL